MLKTYNKGSRHEWTLDTRDCSRKFDNGLTALLWWNAYDACEHGSGNVEMPYGYFQQWGRVILFEDSGGSVWHSTYRSEQAAQWVYDALDRYFANWSDEDLIGTQRELVLGKCGQYIRYVSECGSHDLEPLGWAMWQVHGEPVGPLG